MRPSSSGCSDVSSVADAAHFAPAEAGQDGDPRDAGGPAVEAKVFRRDLDVGHLAGLGGLLPGDPARAAGSGPPGAAGCEMRAVTRF